jgi:hypothetical protein
MAYQVVPNSHLTHQQQMLLSYQNAIAKAGNSSGQEVPMQSMQAKPMISHPQGLMMGYPPGVMGVPGYQMFVPGMTNPQDMPWMKDDSAVEVFYNR